MQFRCQMELESIAETSVNMFLFLVEFFPSNGMTQKAATKYVTKKSNVIKEKNYICLIIVFLAKSLLLIAFTFYCIYFLLRTQKIFKETLFASIYQVSAIVKVNLNRKLQSVSK